MILLAKDHSASVAQVALAWLRKKPAVTSIIIGAKKHDQLLDNLASVEMELSVGEIKQLDDLSAPVTEYPAWMIERQGEGRIPGS
jgi:aryl-alcohol dehydrogenase-like predicted oxidoreductase